MPPWLRKALVALLAPMLFVLPGSSSVALRNVFLWTAFALLAAWGIRSRGAAIALLPPARLWVPIAGWGAWSALSIAWSVDPALSATELRPELLTPIAAFLLFYAVTEDARTFDWWVAALGVGLAVLALLAFVPQLVHGSWDPRRWHVDVGNYSTHAVMTLPLLAWAWLRAEGLRWARLAIVAIALATVVVTYWTENRMAWPTLAAMAAVAALLASRCQAPGHRRRLAALTLAAIAASAALFFMAQHHRQQTLAARGQGITADLSTDPRLRIWGEAVRRIGEAPWAGRGFGRGTLRQPPGAHADGIQDPSQWHAHNVFFNVTLSLGAVGLALFLWVWGAIARELAHAVRAPPPWRWCAVLGVALLVGLVLKNATDDFFVRHVNLLAWSLAGAILGLLRSAPAARG